MEEVKTHRSTRQKILRDFFHKYTPGNVQANAVASQSGFTVTEALTARIFAVCHGRHQGQPSNFSSNDQVP